MAAIIFGPVMTVMGLGFALLFSLAFVKRLGVWFGEFIVLKRSTRAITRKAGCGRHGTPSGCMAARRWVLRAIR
jgi:hypothetical protein